MLDTIKTTTAQCNPISYEIKCNNKGYKLKNRVELAHMAQIMNNTDINIEW